MPTFSELYGDEANRCSVAISNSYNSCGTITRANIKFAVPEDLDDIFQDESGNWRDMEALLSTNLELKSCGIKVSGLYDWLMSSSKSMGAGVNVKKVRGSSSLMEPFILAAQKSVINDKYWAISNGWDGDDGGYSGPLGATPGTSAQRIVRIVSRNDLEGDANWFPVRSTLHIFSRSAAGSAQRGQWKVEEAAVAEDGTYVDILLTTQNAGSSTPYDAAPGQTDTYFHGGVVTIGTNNVSDWESWCNNRPALNPNRMVPFWAQTSRFTLCIDQFYKEWLAYLLERNPLFRKFGDVPIAERNRQLGALFQREWMESFFWGKAISANQTLANWQSLEQINSVTSSIFDTGTEGKLVEYRANAVGVYEQMRQCGRVKDLQGQQLNLHELFDEIYRIKRSRESQGKEANSIDIWTDTFTAAQFQRAMISYYNSEAKGLGRFNWDMTGTTVINKLGFRVKSYELVYPQGVTVNILTDNFFDDFASAAKTEDDENGTSLASTARFMMILDLGGGIYPGVIESNRRVHTVGQLEDLARIDQTYGCVMKNPTKEITLNSTKWTAIVDCPSDNLIIENFNADVEPDTSGKSGVYTDLYT